MPLHVLNCKYSKIYKVGSSKISRDSEICAGISVQMIVEANEQQNL